MVWILAWLVWAHQRAPMAAFLRFDALALGTEMGDWSVRDAFQFTPKVN